MPIINQVVVGSGGGGSSASEPYLEYEVSGGELKGSTTTSHKIDLTGVGRIGPYQLNNAYIYNTVISGAFDLSDVTYVSIYGLAGFLSGCSNITSVNVENIAQVEDYGLSSAFNSTGITTFTMKNFAGGAAGTCGGICGGCPNLTTAKMYSFTPWEGSYYGELAYAFGSCPLLTNVYFYGLNPVDSDPYDYDANFEGLLDSDTNVTVHMPMRIQQSVTDNIANMTNFANGFGGTNTTILYDVVTSIDGANSITYERVPDSMTATADAWIDQNTGNYVYTPRTNLGPSVNDTIYSDAACTQSVTTITAIA